MPHDDSFRLMHINAAGEAVLRWLAGKSLDEFKANDLLRAGVTYELQIIGEAAYHLTDALKSKTPNIPWDRITVMRHRLVHEYYRIDPRILWEVATVHVPILLANIKPLMRP